MLAVELCADFSVVAEGVFSTQAASVKTADKKTIDRMNVSSMECRKMLGIRREYEQTPFDMLQAMRLGREPVKQYGQWSARRQDLR